MNRTRNIAQNKREEKTKTKIVNIASKIVEKNIYVLLTFRIESMFCNVDILKYIEFNLFFIIFFCFTATENTIISLFT